MRVLYALAVTISAVAIPVVASAQTIDTPKPVNREIVVTAARIPGSVVTDTPPIAIIDAAEIASYGASSLDDLIDQLSSKTKTKGARGPVPPVILVNGKRITSPAEIADVPPEALLRFEIFPEKVALEFGYTADQRVVNIILKKKFAATTTEATVGVSTANSYNSQNVSATQFRIAGDARTSLSVKIGRSSDVFARERGIIDARSVPLSLRGVVTSAASGEIDPALSALAGKRLFLVGVPAQGRALSDFAASTATLDALTDDGSTVSPASKTMSLGLTTVRPLGGQISMTMTAGYARTTSRSVLGLAQVPLLILPGTARSPFSSAVTLTRVIDPVPLSAQNRSNSVNAGVTFGGALGSWFWNYDTSWSRTLTDYTSDRGLDPVTLQTSVLAGADPFAQSFGGFSLPSDTTRYRTQTFAVNATIGGSVLDLPAGPLRATIQAGGERYDLRGASSVAGVSSDIALSRRLLAGAISFDAPLASRDRGILEPLGDVAVSVRIANRHYSGVGSLPNWVLVASWSPIKPLNFVTKWIGQKDAPSVWQLGAPRQALPLQVIYDFARGETTLVTLISGGNPDLKTSSRHDYSFQASWKPIVKADLTFSIVYLNARVKNSVFSSPYFTPDVEAALPGRVPRDLSGQIISIDQRDVNVVAERGEQFNWSINFAHIFGRSPSIGRWSLNVNHLIRLRDSRLIRQGLPLIDYHNGAAFSATGGLSHHEIGFDGDWSRNGLSVRVSGSWKQGTLVSTANASSIGSNAFLRFSPAFSVNLRVSLDFNHYSNLVTTVPFLQKTMMTLNVSNLTNNVVEVRDSDRLTPYRYQRGYLDPFGRTFSINFRKQF
jgi:iron complex outermembrane recepter protein